MGFTRGVPTALQGPPSLVLVSCGPLPVRNMIECKARITTPPPAPSRKPGPSLCARRRLLYDLRSRMQTPCGVVSWLVACPPLSHELTPPPVRMHGE